MRAFAEDTSVAVMVSVQAVNASATVGASIMAVFGGVTTHGLSVGELTIPSILTQTGTFITSTIRYSPALAYN